MNGHIWSQMVTCGHTNTVYGHIWSDLDVVDADAAVGEEAVLGALAADSCSSLLWEEVRHGRVPVAEVLHRR